MIIGKSDHFNSDNCSKSNAGDSNCSKNNYALPATLITPSDSYLN